MRQNISWRISLRAHHRLFPRRARGQHRSPCRNWPGRRRPLDAEAQTRRIFAIADEALAKAGASFSDVVRTRMYLTHVEDWEAVGRVHGEFFANIRPAATMVVVAKLLNPAWRIEIEMEAVIPERPA